MAQDRNGQIPLVLAFELTLNAGFHLGSLVQLYLDYVIKNKRLDFANLIDTKGRSLLHYAAIFGTKEQVKFLLEKGCDPLRKDNEGKTPIEMILENESNECLFPPDVGKIQVFLTYFLEKCCRADIDINKVIDSEEKRLIHYALICACNCVGNYINCDTSVVNAQYQLAAEHIKALLELCADITVQDKTNLRPDSITYKGDKVTRIGEKIGAEIDKCMSRAREIQSNNQKFIEDILSLEALEPASQEVLENLIGCVQKHRVLEPKAIIKIWLNNLNDPQATIYTPLTILAESHISTDSQKLSEFKGENSNDSQLISLLHTYAGKSFINKLLADEQESIAAEQRKFARWLSNRDTVRGNRCIELALFSQSENTNQSQYSYSSGLRMFTRRTGHQEQELEPQEVEDLNSFSGISESSHPNSDPRLFTPKQLPRTSEDLTVKAESTTPTALCSMD